MLRVLRQEVGDSDFGVGCRYWLDSVACLQHRYGRVIMAERRVLIYYRLAMDFQVPLNKV